jgi:2-methylcitrate dehydratase PrpD
MISGANQEKKIAERLAEFIVNETYEALPKETVEKAKTYILDLTGCIVGASREQQAKALVEVMKEEGGNPHSSVFAHGFKTSVMNAALLNGAMGHIFDFDDDHREGVMHSSVAVFPAVFALGEKLRVSGRELVRAFVLGSEVMIRIGESFLGKSTYKGFHPTGTCGVFGATAGCASILGLNAEQTTYALGLAGSFAAGVMKWRREGSWQKPLQPGHAGMYGALSAFLGEKNFLGARSIFEEPDGVIRMFSMDDEYDYAPITNGLGEKWEMMDTSIKVHACCRFSATSVDCALDLYGKGVRATEVKQLLVKADKSTITGLCYPTEVKRRPVTHVDAQFSLPYGVGVALCRNRAGVDEFRKEVLRDADVLALVDKVTWEIDPEAEAVYPKAYPATIEATLNDGRKVVSHFDYPKGDPENPASMDEVTKKFDLLTEKFLDRKRREGIAEEISRLEKIDQIGKIADLLR